MKTVLLILLFLGPAVLFGLVKTGVRLIWPMLICVILAAVGMGMLVWGMSMPVPATQSNESFAPMAVYGMLMMITAGFGGVLLGVVVIARWFSGEYQNVNEGQNT